MGWFWGLSSDEIVMVWLGTTIGLVIGVEEYYRIKYGKQRRYFLNSTGQEGFEYKYYGYCGEPSIVFEVEPKIFWIYHPIDSPMYKYYLDNDLLVETTGFTILLNPGHSKFAAIPIFFFHFVSQRLLLKKKSNKNKKKHYLFFLKNLDFKLSRLIIKNNKLIINFLNLRKFYFLIFLFIYFYKRLYYSFKKLCNLLTL